MKVIIVHQHEPLNLGLHDPMSSTIHVSLPQPAIHKCKPINKLATSIRCDNVDWVQYCEKTELMLGALLAKVTTRLHSGRCKLAPNVVWFGWFGLLGLFALFRTKETHPQFNVYI